jgi:formate hydrogenlyase subunit 4
LYLVLAPFAGGLLTGVDRRITARLQGRFGPPILQPFYDVLKLFQKETLIVRQSQNLFIVFYLLFIVFTGVLFFAGKDLLLIIFALTLAGIFLVLAGYKSSSPYSFVGAERELIQMMAYEPMVLLLAVGFYEVTKSFLVSDILMYPHALLKTLPGIFFGFLYVLTIKLRKSPFDLSTSHHGHQEIVKGVTTEYSGPTLGLIEIAHWYEVIFLMGFIFLFFATKPWLGVLLALAAYALEILIDNTFARVRWQWMLWGSWLVALVFGLGNLVVLFALHH